MYHQFYAHSDSIRILEKRILFSARIELGSAAYKAPDIPMCQIAPPPKIFFVVGGHLPLQQGQFVERWISPLRTGKDRLLRVGQLRLHCTTRR